ncbi:unnamed protein product [Protopolystoma xenopodis]|uniref:Uncharacterized protein n=1 Tax=Protopolystoma xenopodis TaxID=117903 RepID=A0A448XIU4_9PLAT|nr:unnamed protein product [Protopolystoma xenopodis]
MAIAAFFMFISTDTVTIISRPHDSIEFHAGLMASPISPEHHQPLQRGASWSSDNSTSSSHSHESFASPYSTQDDSRP